MEFDYNNLSNGDIFRVKSNRLVDHYAVFFRDENDEPRFAHNIPSRDICVDCKDVFFIDRKFISVNKSLISGIDLDSFMKRLSVLRGKKYRLFTYDCEDFVSELTGNMLKRKQNLKYLALASVLVGGVLIYGGFKINNYYKK